MMGVGYEVRTGYKRNQGKSLCCCEHEVCVKEDCFIRRERELCVYKICGRGKTMKTRNKVERSDLKM